MQYRLPDADYAVLDYIRQRNGTHIDHLNIMFGPDAETAVIHLEKYGLIQADFPNEKIYFATVLGQNYHPAKQKSKKQNNTDNLAENPPDCKKESEVFYKSAFFWTVFGVITEIILGIAGIAVNILSSMYFQ